MAGTASSGRRTARWVPYAMIAPTLIFLMIFFVIPIFTLWVPVTYVMDARWL